MESRDTNCQNTCIACKNKKENLHPANYCDYHKTCGDCWSDLPLNNIIKCAHCELNIKVFKDIARCFECKKVTSGTASKRDCGRYICNECFTKAHCTLCRLCTPCFKCKEFKKSTGLLCFDHLYCDECIIKIGRCNICSFDFGHRNQVCSICKQESSKLVAGDYAKCSICLSISN